VCSCFGLQSDSEANWVCGTRLTTIVLVNRNHGEYCNIGRRQVWQLGCAASAGFWGGESAQSGDFHSATPYQWPMQPKVLF